jgi:hypothetical protein
MRGDARDFKCDGACLAGEAKPGIDALVCPEAVVLVVLGTMTKQIFDPSDRPVFAPAIVRWPPPDGLTEQPEIA